MIDSCFQIARYVTNASGESLFFLFLYLAAQFTNTNIYHIIAGLSTFSFYVLTACPANSYKTYIEAGQDEYRNT